MSTRMDFGVSSLPLFEVKCLLTRGKEQENIQDIPGKQRALDSSRLS